MKTKIKKLFKIVFGTDSNIIAKFNITAFISAITFLLVAMLYPTTSTEATLFSNASAFCFVIWTTITKGVESTQKFFFDLIRIFLFFTLLIFSLNICLNLSRQSNILIYGVLNCIVLFFCIFYFVSKISSIFDFIKNLFYKIKNKLFNNIAPATSKWNALIENITAFLVTIGGLTIALKTIAESLLQIKEYFPK